MSTASQFINGNVSVGDYKLLGETSNLVVNSNGTFLKSGVIAKASDYPAVPADKLEYLNPLVPVSSIGSGGCYTAIAIDSMSGIAHVLSSQGTAPIVTVMTATNDISEDYAINTAGAWNTGSSGINKKFIFHKGYPVVSPDGTLTSNAGLPSWISKQLTNSSVYATTVTGPQAALASNPAGNAIGIKANSTVAMYSPTVTGTSSTAAIMPSAANWSSATFNATNTLFIAVASGGTAAAYSATGATWTASTLPATANWSSVFAGSGARTVAVASGSTSAAYSDNGTTWTTASLPVSASWSAVAHNGSLWCAVARNSSIAATSSDGITWTQRTLPATAGWADVKWAPLLGVWLAVADDGRAAAAMSTDGITWYSRNLIRTFTGTVAFNNVMSDGVNTLYAVADATSTFNPTIAKSTDLGATWTYYKPNIQIGYAVPSGYSPIRCLNSKLIVMDWSGGSIINMYTSTDGITWTATTPTLTGSGATPYPRDIAWDGTNYAIVLWQELGATTNMLYTSPDLTTWTQRASNAGAAINWHTVYAAAGVFAAVGGASTTGYIVRSSDHGVTWTLSTTFSDAGNYLLPSGQSATCPGVMYYNVSDGKTFLLGASNNSYISIDASKTWSWSQYLISNNSYYNPKLSADGSYFTVSNTGIGGFTNKYNKSGTNIYSYSGGYTVTTNGGNRTVTTQVPVPLTISGTDYYTDGNYLLKTDPALYINNIKSGTVSTLSYYMRVA